jgi:Matrixin
MRASRRRRRASGARSGYNREVLAFLVVIGLRLHVHDSIADAAFIERQLAQANHHFAPTGVTFEIVGTEPLPESSLVVEDAVERTSFAALAKGRVIDVFITAQLDDIDVPGEVRFGVAWKFGADKKLVILSTAAPDRVLAHELGHVFGLPHSKYAISIMNKTKREQPPPEERTFHAKEIAAMKLRLRALLKTRTLENRSPKR